jgi:predicted regulator of amino acid metabolism with ACT domain
MNKILLVSFLLTLPGCAAPILLTGLGMGSVATQEATGKGITDHVVSTVANQDCKMSRMIKKETICQDEVPEFKFRVVTTGVVPSSIEEIEYKYK